MDDGDERHALGVETIYEGYLLHFGRPRLFAPVDLDTAILLGDYLYARTQSLTAHATQVDPTAKFWFGLTDAELSDVYPWEDWILAQSHHREVPEGMMETDMFVGIR